MALKNSDRGENFKVRVVNEVLSGNITIEGARTKYGIATRRSINSWIRMYEMYGCCSLLSQPDIADIEMKRKPETAAGDTAKASFELEKKVRLLERQLQEQQLLSEMYSRMIDIAEEQYKVSIRKNFSTK